MVPSQGKPNCWQLAAWPSLDRALWAKGCSEPEFFADGGYGHELAAPTLHKIRRGYGRWLSFLDANRWLDPTEPPYERLTRQRLRAYFEDLKAHANADFTIVGRFTELAMAMKILVPHEDAAWVGRPFGAPIRAMLPLKKRTLLVPDGAVLADWAFELMDTADQKPTQRERLCAFRDGLLLAILAYCARRLRSISLLRIGHEIRRVGEEYWIELGPEQVKTAKPDFFGLDRSLTPYIDNYLDEVRPALLGRGCQDAFWISGRGGIWSAKAIQNQVLELSRRRFGTAFGPHRFRYAIAMTAPRLDPASPGLAAGILGISRGVVRDSYDRSNQIEATVNYQDGIAARKKAILARRNDKNR